MQRKFANLHMHSIYSNPNNYVLGSTVREILTLSEKAELGAISICDYGSLGAYREIMDNPSLRNIFNGIIVSGLEIETAYNNMSIDILVYNIKPEYFDKIEEWLSVNVNKEKSIDYQRLELEYYKSVAKNMGLVFNPNITITDDTQYAGRVMGFELSSYPENFDKLSKELIDNPNCFYKYYCQKPGSPFFFSKKDVLPSFKETIDFMHECDAIISIPHIDAHFKNISSMQIKLGEFTLDLINKYDVDCIETLHFGFDEDVINLLNVIKKSYDLLSSQGTDYYKNGNRSLFTTYGGELLLLSNVSNWIEDFEETAKMTRKK